MTGGLRPWLAILIGLSACSTPRPSVEASASAIPAAVETPPPLIEWEGAELPILAGGVRSVDLRDIASDGKRYIVIGTAVGGGPPRAAAWSSADGRAWEVLPVPTPPGSHHLEGLNAVAISGGAIEFVAVGPGAAGIEAWRTSDGKLWNIKVLPGPEAHWAYATAAGPSGWVVVGEKSIGASGEPPQEVWALPEGRLWHSVDGVDWKAIADDDFAGAVLRDVAASPLGYVAVGGYARVRLANGELYSGQEPAEGELVGNAGVWYSSDGERWDLIGGFPEGASPWRVLVTATGFLAIGNGPEQTIGVWRSPDGRHWTFDAVRPDGLTDEVGSLNDVAQTPWGFLGVSTVVSAGQFDGRLWFSPDGLSWRQVPWNPGLPQPALAHVAFGPAGPLVIGTSGGIGEEVPVIWRLRP